MAKSYDVYFGEINDKNYVPGQEGEQYLSQTKTYGYGGGEHYALLTEKEGQYFVREYGFFPERDRIGVGRYDPDILSVESEDTYSSREEAEAKLLEIAEKFHTLHSNALDKARSVIGESKKLTRDFDQFEGLERKKVFFEFIADCIKSPLGIADHFSDASRKMDKARDWFIQQAAPVFVVANHARHLRANDTLERMTGAIALAEQNPAEQTAASYFHSVRDRVKSASNASVGGP